MLLIGERKTTKQDIDPGSDYWPRLTLDPQVSCYLDWARGIGIHADGVLYDVLRVPNLKPLQATPPEARKYTKKTGELYANQRETDETPEEYGARCLAAISENPEKYYQRRVLVRFDKELQAAQFDNWHTASSMRESRRLNVYPRNPDNCKQYNRTCDYFSVCSGTADIDDPLLFERRAKLHEELDNPAENLLTQSSMRCYRACQRRYYYRYQMRMRPRREKSEPLRRGTSVHHALEAWSKTSNVEAAFNALNKQYAYSFEQEKAMIAGYIAMWGPDVGVTYVEKEFEAFLVNPDTGAKSKTFVLGGRLDYVVETQV